MIRMLIKNWWLLLLRGVFALAFAIFIYAFLPFVPAPLVRELAFAGLTVIFALFASATGIITVASAVRGAGKGGSSWLLLADGIAVTAGGLIILLLPGLTLIHVIQLIGFTSLLVGVLEVIAGIHLRRHITDERLLLVGGVVSIIFAFCLFIPRSLDVQAVLIWLSLYAGTNGLAMVGLAWRLRRLRESIHALAAPRPAGKTVKQSGAA